jgi:hypothetical protein
MKSVAGMLSLTNYLRNGILEQSKHTSRPDLHTQAARATRSNSNKENTAVNISRVINDD